MNELKANVSKQTTPQNIISQSLRDLREEQVKLHLPKYESMQR